jgi:HEPN domain-containing protein
MSRLPTEITSRKYLRAAIQRLDAAQALFKLHMNLDAIYLAGYSVECALKSLILERTAASDKSRTLGSFRGRRGHDLGGLKDLLARRHCRVPTEIVPHIARVETWSTELRYEVGRIPDSEAELFLSSSHKILHWVQRSAL